MSDPITFSIETRWQHRLELQAIIVESALAAAGGAGQVIGGAVQERQTIMRLNSSLTASVARSLVRTLTKRLGVKVTADGQTVTIAHPAAPELSTLDLLQHTPKQYHRPGVIGLGITTTRRPMYALVESRLCHHTLIIAPAGWGKAALLRGIAAWVSLTHTQGQAQILIASKDRPLSALPHAQQVERHDLHQLLARRRASGATRPLVYIFIDLDAGRPKHMDDLLTQGPAVGIHLIATTSRPDRMSPLLRGAFGLQVHSHGRPGRYKAELSGNVVDAFDAAVVDDYDLHLVVAHLHRQARERQTITAERQPEPPHLRRQIPVGLSVEY